MIPTSKITANIFITLYLPIIVWALIIFLLSAQSTLPSFETTALDFMFKKCSHMFMYAGLYFLVVRATRHTFSLNSSIQIWFPFLCVIAYAAFDEIHQHFVPGRYDTIRDVGYDTLGAIIVFLRQYRYI